MRTALTFTLLFCLVPAGLRAQQSGNATTTLTVRSTLVEVPALVQTKSGQNVFTLTADDFLLTDDGIPQRLTLVSDTDSRPLALAIVVQTGGAGDAYLRNYQGLGAILDGFIGDVEHRVAVISFDSTPHLLLRFGSSTSDAARQLDTLKQGNQGASILDAVSYAVSLLQTQPARYRRAVLLLSETIDQGSSTTLNQALRLVSNTNTTIYSFAFSSTRFAVSHEASKFNRPDEPGPAHGCFSRQGIDAEYKNHYGKQVLDCISDLAPPLRFATMAFLAARDNLRKNTAESVARLTGGEFFRFRNVRTLHRNLITASNDVPNRYVLSFTPTSPTPGLHVLRLKLKDNPDLRLRARTEYWIDPAPAS
ncbi:MAG: VWA domain-containing protein [Acidobacteriaceae bacterium]